MKYLLYFYTHPERTNFPNDPGPDVYDSWEELEDKLFEHLSGFIRTRRDFAELARVKAINLEFNKLYQTSLADFLIIEDNTSSPKSTKI